MRPDASGCVPDASGCVRMRPDASGCVGMCRDSEFQQISASKTSGSDPLQSEVLSNVNSNFGAVQDVAQPDAQLADQYFAQPESSP